LIQGILSVVDMSGTTEGWAVSSMTLEWNCATTEHDQCFVPTVILSVNKSKVVVKRS